MFRNPSQKRVASVPTVSPPSYTPDWFFRSAHASTILPTIARKMPNLAYARERVTTSDGDFLDVDFLCGDSNKVVVLCHGLEGSSQGKYMRGMARHFHANGWDVAAMNFRGCSGEPNLTVRSYHSGATDDLRAVLAHVAAKGYEVAALVGFSLGGNLILKYLGEDPAQVWPAVVAAATFSVPVDLGDAGRNISSSRNWVYNKRFLRRLENKIRIKSQQFSGEINEDLLKKIKTLAEFDDIYTGPLHGFTGAEDYYSQCSSRQFLPSIKIPTLLVSATNDPFLGDNCYPHGEAEASSCFFFENPPHGGHVGFVSPGKTYWSEARALAFIQEHISGNQS